MKNCLIFLFLLLVTSAFSQQPKYHRVKIYTDAAGLKKLAEAGVTVDHGEVKKGVWFMSDFSDGEVQKIKDSGFQYEILIKDVSEYYRKQNDSTSVPVKKNAVGCSGGTVDYAVPLNFALGTMGGYLKHNEILANLDSMAAKYPSLITTRQPIDTFHSIQGRSIYWVKISDNPLVDENEPEVFYNSLAHAREPAGMSALIFFMWYALENYGTDPEITYIVDNTEMYFVPCVNPDGYIYNETTNPSGGGMWRKNRRNNGDGTFGVDLNRNYGFMWGYDDSGSSPNTSDDTYRGTSAFSEPEINAMKWFCESRQFRITLNYHTYGNWLIYPWGYIPSLTPDSDIFIGLSQLFTSENNYTFGTGYETVGYSTNGDSDDWMYGEQSSKGKIFSMTPEAGAGGFWPSSSSIIGICKENLKANIYVALCAGRYAVAEETSSYTVSQLNGYFYYSIQRLGLDTPGSFTVTFTALDTVLTFSSPTKQFSNLNLLETRNDSVAFTLSAYVQSGQTFRFLLEVNNGSVSTVDTITKMYGQFTAAFTEPGNNLMQWTNNGWTVSNSVYVSAPSSITDSQFGNYSNNENATVTTANPIDLTGALTANLNFWARWDIEAGWDYVEVMASSDGGSSWTPLCGKYTKTGNSNQDNGQPLYDGTQTTWVFEEVNLDDYAGQSILIRFKLISDGGVTADGFYFDDLEINYLTATVLSTAVNSTGVTCNGYNDGTATVIASGGTLPYTYLWNNGGSQSSVTGLIAGTYYVTVTDSKGTSAINTGIITEPLPITMSTYASDALCYNGDGYATVTASGGTGSLTYSWSTGQTGTIAADIPAGLHGVTVTDFNGCNNSQSVTVNQPSQMILSVSIGNATCGNADGNASVTASGGTGGYSYAWSNNQSTSAISGLTAGNYTVTVIDGNNCSQSVIASVNDSSAPSITISSIGLACYGDGDGTSTVSASGGTPPYTYQWDSIAGNQTDSIATGLSGGTFSVSVFDGAGCLATQSVNINEPDSLTVTALVTHASAPVNNDGTIDLIITGGTGIYTYLWNTGDTTQDIAGLSSGSYTVTVTDGNNCLAVYTDTVELIVNEFYRTLNTDYLLLLYPNPNHGKFNVELYSSDLRFRNFELNIINILGEVILQNEIRSSLLPDAPENGHIITSISCTGLSKGIFFYRVYTFTGECIGSGKMIIE